MMLIFFSIILLSSVSVRITAKDCPEHSLHFESSTCDANGKRWVFKVPDEQNECNLTTSSIPRRVENCEKLCPGGTYFDVETQDCAACPIGTFSRGDTIEYSEWHKMPGEFSIDKTYDVSRKNQCQKSSWYPKDDYLMGKAEAGCAVTLSMQLDNSKDGEVSFTYSIEDYRTMAFFTMRNAHCSQVPGTSFLLQHTGSHIFLNVSVKIPKGQSVLQWYLFSENNLFQSLFGTPDSVVKIARIRITGTPPIWRCTDCPAGTFSKFQGASSCDICPADTFSVKGSSECIPCKPEEYSKPGSSICTRMDPCTPNDYMEFWSPCDDQGYRRKQWKWIEPKICNDKTGVSLPAPDSPMPCGPCSLGTFLNARHQCELCPVPNGSVAKLESTCVSCDANHVPAVGLTYSSWSRMPPFMKTECRDPFGSFCQPWSLGSDFIGTGTGLHPNAVSTLTLAIPKGFVRSDELFLDTWSQVTFVPPVPDTYLRVEFELRCKAACELQLKQHQVEREENLITTWSGTVRRQNYTWYIKDSRPTNFTWAFQKPPSVNGPYDHDHVRIYHIEVSNAVGMSVIGCRKCLKGMKDGKCVSCPRGLFYEELINVTSHQTVVNCTKCPPDHIVIADATVARSVAEACVPCEPGTKAVNNTICVIDTTPAMPNGPQYNVTKLLATEHRFNGTRMFTPSGNRYSHEFRLSLTYGKTTECVEQLSRTGSITSSITVNAMICRHTCVWTSTNPERTAYTKPISLADRLIRAVASNYSESFWKEVNTNLTRAGWTPDATGSDLHYIFETYDMTPTCPHGRHAVVTLRCSQGLDRGYDETTETESSTGVLEVPPLCPDGTCDGCLYQFMWTGLLACPVCRHQHFYRFVGECHNGRRNIYLIPPRGCRVVEGTSLREVESCPWVTKGQLAAIILTLIVMIMLSLVIVACHRRNKRLEYKYMKLIQSAEGKCQQPTSCALDEHEEDTVDSFGRRQIRSNAQANLGLELEPTALASIMPVSKVQMPRIGPIVYKSKSDTDTQCLPENEVIG